MKWFRHETDAHTHPKIKQLIKEFGAEGYMVCFATFEIIGRYGDKYLRLSLEKYPKTDLADTLRVKEDTIEKVWQSMAKKSLLSRNHLKNNVLYSTKLKERVDEYTQRMRSLSRQHRDNIGVDNITLHKIRLQYITLKGWDEKTLLKGDYARIHRAIKDLLLKTKGDVDYALKTLHWVAATCRNQGLSWTMETVVKWYSEYYKKYPPVDKTPQTIKDLTAGIGREV